MKQTHLESLLRLIAVLLLFSFIALLWLTTHAMPRYAWIGVAVGVVLAVLSVRYSISLWNFEENTRKDKQVAAGLDRLLVWASVAIVLIARVASVLVSGQVRSLILISGLTWIILSLSATIGLIWWHRPKEPA